jgi:hypothetical protein
VIRKQDGQIRVERSEGRARANAGVIVLIAAMVVALALMRAHQPLQYVLIALLAAILAVSCWLVYRPRPVVVIAPREVRWSSGRQAWAVPREEVAAVRVVPGMWTQLLLLDRRGKVLRAAALPYFSPQELRQAFRQARLI